MAGRRSPLQPPGSRTSPLHSCTWRQNEWCPFNVRGDNKDVVEMIIDLKANNFKSQASLSSHKEQSFLFSDFSIRPRSPKGIEYFFSEPMRECERIFLSGRPRYCVHRRKDQLISPRDSETKILPFWVNPDCNCFAWL